MHSQDPLARGKHKVERRRKIYPALLLFSQLENGCCRILNAFLAHVRVARRVIKDQDEN